MNPIDGRVRTLAIEPALPAAAADAPTPPPRPSQPAAGHEFLTARGAGRVSPKRADGSESAPARPTPPALRSSVPHGGLPGSPPFVRPTVRSSLLGVPVAASVGAQVASAKRWAAAVAATGGAASRLVARKLTAWLERRPAVEGDAPLRGQGRLYQYREQAGRNTVMRHEAIYAGTPGVAAAVLGVHSRAGATLSAAQAAARLADPPIGLLAGVWESPLGGSFHVHNNRLHVVSAQAGIAVAPGRWRPVTDPIAMPTGPHERIEMLGQQADHAIYARKGSTLLKLGRETVESIDLGVLDARAVVRVGADQIAYAMHDGELCRLSADPAAAHGVARPVELLRTAHDDAGALEPSPAMPKDFLLHGEPGAERLLVLDHKGRLYEADPAMPGTIRAARLSLPAELQPQEDWAVASIGRSRDGALQALCEHKDGRRMSLQRPRGAAAFEPAFTLDQPLLLLSKAGLHAPADDQMGHRINYDGHAEFATHLGVAHFRESPDHPWTELLDGQGQPLAHVQGLAAGPFGFVDRRPVYALLGHPAAIVELKLEGRTTVLPAIDPAQGLVGGPLAVVPAKVSAATEPLLEFGDDGPQVQAFAVDKQRHVYLLDAGGRILGNCPRPDAATDAHATALRPLDEGLAKVLGITLSGDNHLHALSAQDNGRVALKRLNSRQEWEDVPIDLSAVNGIRPQALRSSRTGQIEIQLERQSWHALLPPMTDPQTGALAPARVDAQPIDSPPGRGGINAGANETINRQGPTRFRLPSDNHDTLVTTTLMGNTSTDPLSATSNLQTLANNTRSHVGALATAVVDAFRDTARAAGNALGYTALPASQFARLKVHFHEADQAHQALRALLADDGGASAGAVGSPRLSIDELANLRGVSRSASARSEDARTASSLGEQLARRSGAGEASRRSAPIDLEMGEMQRGSESDVSSLLSRSERLSGGSARINEARMPRLPETVALSAGLLSGVQRLLANTTRSRGTDDAALSTQDRARLIDLRESTLQSMLTDLRKIGIRQRVLEPTFKSNTHRSSASTLAYGMADAWRNTGIKITDGLVRMGRPADDILPGLARCFESMNLADASDSRLSDRERDLIGAIRDTLSTLRQAGLRVAGRPEAEPGATADASTRDQRDPTTIRSASIAHAMVGYDALLKVSDAAGLQAAQERADASGPHALSRFGLSSWHELEAFDDVVSTFRAEMATPHSARRQQLLKSMGLPADAAVDQMAAGMTTLLQDLYQRCTFFSNKNDSLSLGGKLGRNDWEDWNAFPLALGGEAIHALGVEMFTNKEGLPLLVGVFLRHAKASGAISSGVNIDLNPGKGTGMHVYGRSASGETTGASWSGAATVGRLAATSQHGVGAGVLLLPETIPEFTRLLFDVHDADPTRILRNGVNKGALGFDLFELNMNLTSDVSVSANAVDTSRPYGTAQRSSAGFSIGGQARASANAHIAQMELHLDHAWNEVLGIEYHGAVDLRVGANALLRAGGSLGTALGGILHQLTSSTGLGSLQLAGINLAVGDANLPLDVAARSATTAWNAATGRNDAAPMLGTATYRRTLDAEAARSVSADEWSGMTLHLAEVFPGGIAELGDARYPALPSERLAFIDRAIARIQGPAAVAIEAGGAFDGPALARQRSTAREATHAEAGGLWHARSEFERAGALDSLRQLRQQEVFALNHRARIVPGARIELNLLGRESLDLTITRALGHLALGGKMGEAVAAADRIPGLADVMRRFKGMHNINQVRFIFEMRPQAIAAINDALALKEQDESRPAAGPLDPVAAARPQLDWRAALDKARSSPDMYRLAAIAPHNTDDNPSTSSVGSLGLIHSTSASASHQLFQAEVKFRYGLYDELVAAEILEGGHRALSAGFEALRGVGLAPLETRPALSGEHFGPVSPSGERAGLAAQRERFEQRPRGASTT